MLTRGSIGRALAALTLIAAASGAQAVGQSPSADTAAVRHVVDDYIGLYRKETLERWKTLFLPGFAATYTNDDGSVTTRTLEDFYERQRAGFARGPMTEALENVRVERRGRLAHATADFVFASGGPPRRGQLTLLMIEENGQLKIAALTFTYHLQ